MISNDKDSSGRTTSSTRKQDTEDSEALRTLNWAQKHPVRVCRVSVSHHDKILLATNEEISNSRDCLFEQRQFNRATNSSP